MTFQTILVPRARTDPAAAALPVATRLAQSSHADLRFMPAAQVFADLVVAARHGQEKLEGFWVDGETEYLIQHREVPVLLLGPQEAEAPAACGLRSILVALDLSANAEAILEPVIALANLSGGHLTLVHVIEPVAAAPMLARRRELAQQQLDCVADRLRYRGLSVGTRLLCDSSAAQALLGELEKLQYDVIATTTHGAGGVHRIVLGSVAESLIRRARKPVLLVRPSNPPPADRP
jgi:nucleotide-binding universal stress UspA family protein